MPIRTRLLLQGYLFLAALPVAAVALLADEARPDADEITLSGSLVDSEGNPITGGKLTVISVWKLVRGSRERAPGGGFGVSDAQGRVKIEGLPRGRILSLRFSHPDFPRYWFEATSVKDPAIARKTSRWEILADNFRITLPRLHKVQIRLAGNDGKLPLGGAIIEARPAPDNDQIHFDNEWSARVTTDPEGIVTLLLPQGRYDLTLGEDCPLDCIELNEPHIGVRGVGHLQSFLRMTRRGTDLVFKAVDVDTGAPIPGVSFWREMPAGEYWFEIVRNETIGNAKDVRDEEARKAPYVTDERGLYSCQVRPARGWTYHVHHMPEGFEEVDTTGQTFDIPSEGRIEKTFLLRRTAKKQ